MTLVTGLVGELTGMSGPLNKLVAPAADGVADTVAGVGLNAIASWVLGGTESALKEVAHVIGADTTPELSSAWFSGTYWRVAGLAAILTLPFVFAATVQALFRSDLALLARVVFAYLPLSLLAVSLAAPVTMLLLSATDQMCAAVSSSALSGGAHFLDQAAASAATLSTAGGSPFLAVAVGLLTVAAALTLAIELLVREAAVYVVVLMLPLAFAAFVWPARRIWAIRLVELLVSLILSKFVIVAVLSLAGAAFGSGGTGISRLLTAMSLLLLSTFAPWTLMRILPFTELAAGAAGAMRHELPQMSRRMSSFGSAIEPATDLIAAIPDVLRSQATAAGQGFADWRGGGGGGAGEAPLPTGQPLHMSSTPAPVGGSRLPEPEPEPEPEPRPDAAPEPPVAGEPKPHPFAHIDPNLRFNAGPGGWWKQEDE
ncbi:MAG TPA: hypothetical protein VME01_02335 [Solirubrobacteraceae bacterium]|nr:hypothetical protein [Solirubrobacteraceae bacterium]